MKKRILIVDDEEALLVTLSDYLDFEGFEVEKARTGEAALRKVDRFEPHLVVLDIAMPGIGGMGFLKEISGRDGRPRYPILVLTARANMAGFFESLDVDGFLPKPCEKSDLLNKIESIIAMHEEPQRPADRLRARLLLGEDDPQIAAALRRSFTIHGYNTEIADTGPLVLEKAATHRPDVVLVKDILTHMNGAAVAALLKSMPATRDTPVILYDDGVEGITGSTIRPFVSGGVAMHVRNNQPAELLRAVTRALSA